MGELGGLRVSVPLCTITYHCDCNLVHLLLICLYHQPWMETVLGACFGGDGGRRQRTADDDGALVDLRSGSEGPLVTLEKPWGLPLHVSRCSMGISGS